MKNSLEDFIRNNREAFDDRTPAEGVWKRIQAALTQRSSFWNSVHLWRVAAMILLGLSVYLWASQPDGLVSRKEMAVGAGEFSDVESFYKEQIAEKVALIQNFENGYEDDHFTQDLQKLDAMYQVLRDEMKTKPSDKVKDALVLNMLVRIDLLNQQIQRLEDSGKAKAGEVSI